MAVLGRAALAAVLALCLPASGWAHMGPSFPLVHAGGEQGALAAAVLSSYLAEQMGREVTVVEKPSAGEALAAVAGREAPLALVRAGEWDRRPGLVAAGPLLPGPGGDFLLAAGSEAASQLAFSLLPDYAARLARAWAGWDWDKALTRVRGGEGRRKVALDLLRDADLI